MKHNYATAAALALLLSTGTQTGMDPATRLVPSPLAQWDSRVK